MSTVRIYCPKCQDIYYPRLARHTSIDGAYFGTTFPHLLLQTYPELQPPPVTQVYVPRIYGFKIHQPSPPIVLPSHPHRPLAPSAAVSASTPASASATAPAASSTLSQSTISHAPRGVSPKK
jgi:casein kinase II subunit beta